MTLKLLNSKYYSILDDAREWKSVVSDSCDPMDCSPPGSSVRGILQARILEWVTIPLFSSMLGNRFLILKTDKEKWSSIHSVLLAQPFFQDNKIVDEGNKNTRNQRIGKSPFDSSFENFIYLFISGCAGSWFLHRLLSNCSERELPSSRGAQPSHDRLLLLPSSGSLAPKLQSLSPRLYSTGSIVAHKLTCSTHVGTSQIRDQIHVSCTGKQILHHWATKEAPFDSPQWSLVKVKSLSRVWFFVTPWTVAHQAPPSMGFSRQEYWSGLPWSLGIA